MWTSLEGRSDDRLSPAVRQPSCAAPRSPRVYLAALKAGRASLSARGKQIETEAGHPSGTSLGISADSEQAIRWLIALMVMCCDPLAIALTAAAPAGRARP